MQFGVHLPQIVWDDERVTLERLVALASEAERLGFGTLAANDHLVFQRPWLDGPTALAAVMSAAPSVRLMTSVSLPVVRGPFALAKSLAALDLLSGGRLDAGLGPGSSQADYDLVGIPFTERWARFDEAVRAMRAVWQDGGRAVRRDVLRHDGRRARPDSDAPAGAADLDRELGLDRWSASRRASG